MKKALFAALALSLFTVASAIAAPLGGDPTVRLLTDASGVDDKSFNAAAWRGILQFYGDTLASQSKKGSAYDAITAQTQDMYVPNIKQVSDEKYGLVVTTGFTFAEALAEVAPQYPDQKYLIVDEVVDKPNILSATFTENEGSYLVGVAAALKAKADGIKNPRFGFIGGIPGAVITKFEVGYAQGVLSVLPKAQIVDYYANDWGKPELAKAQAKNWFDSGVYCIFSAAGFTGSGAIAMAKEYRASGKNVWAIGVDSDQYEDGIYDAAKTKSAVLTSMIKRVESATLYALNAVRDGSFKGGVVVFDLKSDGVGFSDRNAALGKDIIAKLALVKADLVSGKVKAYAKYAEAKAAMAVPADLQAKDD
jgi:basic membrane protein A and related proteins